MAKNQHSKKRTGFLYRRVKGKDYSLDDPEASGGIIWLQYRLHGKIHRQSLKTSLLKEAEKKRDEIMDPLRSADEVTATAQLELRAKQAREKLEETLKIKHPPLAISNAWGKYQASHERPDSSQRTLKDYALHWRRFSKWLSTEHSEVSLLKDITSDIASEYASHLVEEQLSPNTFNKRINFLKLLCTTLKKPAHLNTNPFEEIRSKKLKTTSKRELTQHELKTVLDTANGDLQILLYLGTFTGLRLGDCVTLKWGEVDMDKLLIRRIPNKIRSRKPKPIIIGIPAPLYDLLNDTPTSKRKGFMLPALANVYQEDATKITRRIQKHFTDCGIQTHKEGTGYKLGPDPKRKGKFKKVHTGKRAVVEVGFHSLRHTFVSLHAAYGTPQAVIMAIVGHGNPAMTAHYTHIGEDTARQAADALASAIPDAEFEVIDEEIVPEWIIKKLKTQTAKNWKKVRDELVKK